jgi:prefoldin subunit 5
MDGDLQQELLSGAEHLHNLITANDANSLRCANQLESYHQLRTSLTEILKKRRHPILAPVAGGLGYFEGELVHTNDVLVLLGDNWWANTSVFHATEVASRRIAFLQREQKVLLEEKKRLQEQEALFSQVHTEQRRNNKKQLEGEQRAGDAAVRAQPSPPPPCIPSPSSSRPATTSVEAAADGNEACDGDSDPDIDESAIVVDPEDELTTQEMLALEDELGENMENDDFVEKVLLERMLQKRAKRLALAAFPQGATSPSPATTAPSFVSPSEIGKGFSHAGAEAVSSSVNATASPAVVALSKTGSVGEVVERTVKPPVSVGKEAVAGLPVKESLFRKSQK